MAYNPLYPYQAYNYNPYQQIVPMQSQQGQIQNNGFISVRSIEEAINWPIAPGNSLTFKDESAPYIYTKTKGFSQLEQPIFEKFRLVKEEPRSVDVPSSPPTSPTEAFDAKGQIESLWEEVGALKTALEALKAKPKKQPAKKEDVVDEQ